MLQTYKLQLTKKHKKENRKGLIHVDNLDFWSDTHKRLDEHREIIGEACDTLVDSYKEYITNESGYNSKATFERAAQHGLSPEKMISVLEDIESNSKALVFNP
ncbi:hypothetical protein CEQ07_03860 [Oligella urethralis]|uniref:hypothetical protein n=1 Tax=Oligella urethralis TaxID=90245 RepID=UPI000CFEEAD5|nr:hypothetical protein [Oligella urethralis]AVL70639.1 hypothetical protein CEQ07_03860 [Oligella urethralis]